MKNTIKVLFSVAVLIFGLGVSRSVNAQVVINEVYGGGGNANAPFNADFVELFNQGGTAVNLMGYSIFYKTATGANFTAADSVGLTGTIPAMGFYLVQVSNAGTNGAPLPMPNQTVNIGLAATSGNILLSSPMFVLNAPFTCAQTQGAAGVADKVAYGTGNCPETAAAPAASNTMSVNRTAGIDTNNNSVDFTLAAPTPQAAGTTAAPGVVGGTVRSPNGRGLRHVIVMITGGSLDEPLYATTNQFGKYQFEAIPVGESYVLTVFSRRYNFSPSSRVISLNSSLTDADFGGVPNKERDSKILKLRLNN